MTNMTFGECLRSLLSILDISMNRLSKAINVDNSLINRWIHEKRIPAYNTAYIENIAEYLSRSFHNSTQIKSLDALLYKVCDNNPSTVSIKDKIKIILSECQGYSIECRKKENKKNSNLSTNQELSHNSLYCTDIILEKVLSLSSDDKIFFGNISALSSCIQLLKSATSSKNSGNNTIYITYYGYLKVQSSDEARLMAEMKTQLLIASEKNIEICFLLKLDSNIDRIISFIKFISPVFMTKKLKIYYYIRYDIIDSEREMCIVPGLGALSCFPCSENSYEKSGFLLRNSHAVNIFHEYIKTHIKSSSRPLIEYYPDDKQTEYYSSLFKSQEYMGNSFLCRTAQHPLMMTPALYKNILERKNLSPKDISFSMETFEIRLNEFKKGMCYCEYYDVCSVKTITDLIRYRKFPALINGIIEIVSLSKDEVLEIMENIIDIINSFKNYKLSLVRNIDFLMQDNCYIFINEKCALHCEMYFISDTAHKTKMFINEPIFVSAAEKYFMEKYEQIAPINKDRHEIIKFMKKQMKLLDDM